jgi:hypothetical protein
LSLIFSYKIKELLAAIGPVVWEVAVSVRVACVFASPDSWTSVWSHNEVVMADEGNSANRSCYSQCYFKIVMM